MSTIERLAELLQQEIDAYSQLLELERRKEQAIISNDAETLLEILQQQEPVVASANSLENDILNWRKAYGRLHGGSDALTLREIIAGMKGNAADDWQRLESLRVRLFGLAEEIRKINQTNYLLLKQSIELLDEVVTAVLGQSATCSTYTSNGRVQPEQVHAGTLRIKA